MTTPMSPFSSRKCGKTWSASIFHSTPTHYQTRDGFQQRMIVFRNKESTSKPTPLVVTFHGGGYTTVDQKTAVPLRKVAQVCRAVCISASYRLATENPFPTPVNDAWDALKWIVANSKTFDADPEAGFIVGGVSAGRCLSSVISHLARDKKLQPPITSIFLQAPSLLPASVFPEKDQDRYLSASQLECLDNKALTPELKWIYYKSYNPDPHSPLYAPFNWPTGHNNLPPHYIQVCGRYVNRDQALIYESVLREEYRIPTKLDMYPGPPHIFWQIY